MVGNLSGESAMARAGFSGSGFAFCSLPYAARILRTATIASMSPVAVNSALILLCHIAERWNSSLKLLFCIGGVDRGPSLSVTQLHLSDHFVIIAISPG